MASKSKINTGLIAVVFSLFTAGLIVFVVSNYPQLVPSRAATSGNDGSIILNKTNPRAGDAIDFTINSNINQPYVNLWCVQGDAVVKSQTKAYFGENARYFILYEPSMVDAGWETGGAHCTASLWDKEAGSKMYSQIEFDVAP